jgi:IclR family transcriptional regulator, acetate operon repressor
MKAGKRCELAASWSGIRGLVEDRRVQFICRRQSQLTWFARNHNAAVGLWNVSRSERVKLIALGENESPTRILLALGQRQPLGAGSIGRALAAEQDIDKAELRRRFAECRWACPLNFTEFATQVEQSRRDGFATNNGFAFAGVASVACFLAADSGQYCVSASVFAGTRDVAEMRKLGLGMRRTAATINAAEMP